MASQPPIVPPQIAGAAAHAKIDQIAVRIITLPENTKTAPSPTKLSGTVTEQNTDGSVNIKTERGELKILLHDKGSLPQGLKIDIEIPAGRNPQQAHIRTSDIQQSQTPKSLSPGPPTLQQALQQGSQRPAQNIEQETLGKIITASQIRAGSETVRIPIAGGALQTGQIVRLLPISPADMTPQLQATLSRPLPLEKLITGFVDTIENLPPTQSQLRLSLIQNLSRIDFSGLQPLPSPETRSASPPPLSPQISLMERINDLLKSAGLPLAFTPSNGRTEGHTPPLLSALPQGLSLFNPSKSVDGQILSFQPATSPLPLSIPNTTPLSSAPVSAAQILGVSQIGLPILSVPLPHTGLTQIYTMQFGANNIQSGMPVFIALDPASTKNPNSLFFQSADGLINIHHPLSKPILTHWVQSGTWDSLDDLLKNMSHLAPTQAHSFSQMMPNPLQPSTMGALSLFFLSLVRSGDTEAWMTNESINLLRQAGKSDILRNVASDISLSSKMETIALPQDWRLTLLPMLWENQIHKMPVYYKHLPDEERNKEDDEKKRRKLRFLFDLNLSRMGGVQVDGFMQSERLDIILRTKSPLSPPMQSQMKKIYAGAMDKSRLTGDLSFQFRPEHWVDFSNDLAGNLEKTGLNA